MTRKVTLILASILVICLAVTSFNCKKKDKPVVKQPEPKQITQTVVAPPREPEVQIPAFNEDAYVEIAAYVDHLRDNITDESKVAAGLIEFIKQYGFIVKDEQELESAMIGMSEQFEALCKDPVKGKEYREQVEQRVRDRLDALRREELQRLSKEANEANEAPPEEQPQVPEHKEPITPTEQPK